MKTLYNSPVAEILAFAKEDILTGSDESTIEKNDNMFDDPFAAIGM